MAHLRGVTNQYVGAATTDFWSVRLDQTFVGPFGACTADSPYAPARLAPAEISKEMSAAGFSAEDVASEKHRHKFTEGIRRRKHTAWQESERAAGMLLAACLRF